MPERTTVRLPQELLERAKRKAAADRRTLTSLIEEGLRIVVAGKRKAARARTLPRISEASGGPMPGLDLSDFSVLQEMEDLDRIAPMKRRQRARG